MKLRRRKLLAGKNDYWHERKYNFLWTLIKLILWGLHFIYSIVSFERNFSIIRTRSFYTKFLWLTCYIWLRNVIHQSIFKNKMRQNMTFPNTDIQFSWKCQLCFTQLCRFRTLFYCHFSGRCLTLLLIDSRIFYFSFV